MLKQRIITALLLLVFFLPALFSSQPEWLGIVGLILVLAGAWEWGRLNGLGFMKAFTLSAGCLVIFLVLWLLGFAGKQSIYFWLTTSLFWILISTYFLKSGVDSWKKIHFIIRNLVGLVLLSSTGLAFYQAKLTGTSYITSILLLVWVADIAAFFVGRRFGKNKLAPSISPGKSIEGLLGGIVAVWFLAYAWIELAKYFPNLDNSIFHKLSSHSLLAMLTVLTFLTFTSAVGDLFESLIKRSAGMKDSSQLLPGHGGVLDRLDALLPVLPLALLLTFF